MRFKIVLCYFFVVILLAGCAATLPPKMEVSKNYTTLGVKTYSLKVEGSRTNIDSSLNKAFLPGYCKTLEGNIKMAIIQVNPEFQFIDGKSDISVEVTLEELQGGSAEARFWIGFGAGRTVTTVFVRIFKKGEIQAEGRITETTTLPNLATNNFSNEDALIQDIPLLSKSIAKFVSDPSGYAEAQRTMAK
jgi:hypothetical protein